MKLELIKKWIVVLLIFLCSLLSEGGVALKAKPLEVGVIWFPPFYTIEKDLEGRVTGISGLNVDIITKVLDSMGKSYELKYYPAKRLYRNLTTGSTDIFYGIKVPPSLIPSQDVLYSQTKINRITLRVFHLKSAPVIRRKEDLVGKSVIVFRGYGYGGFIDYLKNPSNQLKIYVADTQINGFKMLKKERAAYLVAFERPAVEAMRKFPKGTMTDVVQSAPLFQADGYFIVSSKTPNASQLLAEMETVYGRLKEQGLFSDLLSEKVD